jgi:D-alanine-D-alanine ligase-like ATP-grasp enzyme
LGAKEEFMDIKKIPPKIKNVAIRAARALDIQIAGVDILIDKKGNLWVLEVNRGPGLTYDSKVSPELDNLASFFAQELRER